MTDTTERPSLVNEAPISRAELLELLPDKWPGLSKAFANFRRYDSLSTVVILRLLTAAKVALEQDETQEKRVALVELLAGAMVSRERFNARERELLDANSRELERGREARAFARRLASLTLDEVEFNDLGAMRDEARRVIGDELDVVAWRPKYGASERERAIAIAAQALSLNDRTAGELVDQIAEALGMERAG